MVIVLSSGRCAIQDAPCSPASASAHGSRNKQSSRRLSLARTAAVQQAVAANVDFEHSHSAIVVRTPRRNIPGVTSLLQFPNRNAETEFRRGNLQTKNLATNCHGDATAPATWHLRRSEGESRFAWLRLRSESCRSVPCPSSCAMSVRIRYGETAARSWASRGTRQRSNRAA